MAADRFINWLMRKYNNTKIIGERVRLGTLEPGDYFIFPTLYNGLIGQLIEAGINSRVKWINHPERTSKKAEMIASTAEVYKYDYS